MLIPNNHFRRNVLLISGVWIALIPSAVQAGWFGFRNDTGMTLVVQETSPRQGKPQRLYANETIRDTQSTAVPSRRFVILDSKGEKTLYTGTLTMPTADENLLFVVKSDGKGGVTIDVLKASVVNPKNPTPTPKNPTPTPKNPTPTPKNPTPTPKNPTLRNPE